MTSVPPLARALVIIEKANLASSLHKRVDAIRERLSKLVVRTQQIDALGDLDNEPETLFAILGDDSRSITGYDSAGLRKARLGQQGSKALSAEALLSAVGWESFGTAIRSQLEVAIADLKDRERFESWGLFVGTGRQIGLALGINFAIRDGGREVIDLAAADIRKQAGIVVGQLLARSEWEMSIEWPASFAGESIGLPLTVALLTAQGELPRDALLASTGCVDLNGNVLGVVGITEKIQAAKHLGMRRVLVPKENLREAEAIAPDHVSIIGVGHINEVTPAVRRSLSAVDFDFAALTRLVRASVRDYGLYISDEADYQHGRRFVVGNTTGKIHLWVYTNGRVSAQGNESETLAAAQRLIRDRVPSDPDTRPTKSFEKVNDSFGQESRAALERIGACVEEPRKHEAWRLRLKRGRSVATVVCYSSGKCVLQGTAPAWDTALDVLDTVLAPVGGLKRPESDVAVTKPAIDPSAPHIGTDEAGKGDYFGPLVSAAVYVDGQLAEAFRNIGVRDSKTLSDNRVRELAEKVRVLADGRFAVTPIYPKKYNELQSQFAKEGKNLNSMLAWGHAKSIDRLLSAPAGRGIQPTFVLVDQFADARVVEDRTRRVRVPLYQRPKAEDDVAVAAASILARDAFLHWLETWSSRTGMTLPKGASEQVISVAKTIRRRWGMRALSELAKVSFRTTKQVLEGEENAPTEHPPWTDSEYAVEG
jgi:ribonuclease HIII